MRLCQRNCRAQHDHLRCRRICCATADLVHTQFDVGLNVAVPHRVLRVNYAQPMKIKGGDKGFSHQAVWADADQYLDERLAEQELNAHERREAKKGDAGVADGAGNTDGMMVDI